MAYREGSAQATTTWSTSAAVKEVDLGLQERVRIPVHTKHCCQNYLWAVPLFGSDLEAFWKNFCSRPLTIATISDMLPNEEFCTAPLRHVFDMDGTGDQHPFWLVFGLDRFKFI
jgi:hypothetical protein